MTCKDTLNLSYSKKNLTFLMDFQQFEDYK